MESSTQSLVGNVGQLLAEEYWLLRGVGREVAELRDDLATMNALLRMQSEADDGAVDHFVREWMKQVRELAYDAEDCIDQYLLRVKSSCRPPDHGGGVSSWLKQQLLALFLRHRLAGEISAHRARAVAISERHARYGVSRDALLRSPSPPVLAAASEPAHGLHRAKDPDHHQLVGIGEQADSLVARLKVPVGDKREHKVFSVVGFGGVGKTTLAMEVCRRLETEFQRQAMVSVSQAFEPSRDLKPLLKRVLQQVVKAKTDNETGIMEEHTVRQIESLDADQLAEKLKECLTNKRYLILIDDIWTIRAWEAIQSVLPENNCNSRIIVTTRIDSVAKFCSPASVNGHCIHHMEPLNLEDSKKLFLSKAFGSMDASYPEELEDAMGNILKKCGGLPLAIVSIANILAGYRTSASKDKWETICKSIGSLMESNPTLEGMRHIVTLSYNHLPLELKGCMMYLSIFPEDYEINKDRLLRRWIAEGLVPEKRGLTLMEVAESYLDELVSRNMIEPRFGYDGKVESCRVHDMLLEVLVSKSLEYNFVCLLGGQYIAMPYGRIRRLSIHSAVEQEGLTESPPKKKMKGYGIEGLDIDHVRSLSMFRVKVHKLLDHLDMLSLLRVLDLEDCEGLTNGHMTYVCKLYLLQFLSVKGTNISEMPPQIGNLERLQTLDAYNTCLRSLPETVTNLEKLERLEFQNKIEWYVLWSLPRGLNKMKALREVQTAVLGNEVQVAQELGELQQLQSLNMYIDCPDDGEVVEALAASLSKLYSLRRLNISNINIDNGTMSFLDDIPTPPRLLRYLRIEGVLQRLPSWVESLTYLAEFSIMRAELVDDNLFSVLYKLPNLKSICMGRKCYASDEIVARSTYIFPVLSNLSVTCDEISLPKVFRFEEGSMRKLETLKMNFTEVERSIVGIEHLTNLKEVELTGTRNNPSLDHALDQLTDENRRRPEPKQFQVVVKYYE